MSTSEKIKNLISQFGIIIVLLFFMIFFTIATPRFLTPANLLNVLRQVAPVGIAAVGMTLVIISGGIDLTVGSVVALVSVVCAKLMTDFNMPVFLVILAGLLIGTIVGLINGLAVTKFNFPPFIFTLALMTGIRGVCYIITMAMPIFGFTKAFDFLGKGYILDVPIPVILMFTIFALGWVLVEKTRFGRYIYAIGGNKEATRLSGVNVEKNVIINYAICGALAAFSGLIILSRLSSGQPSVAENFAFDIITAVALGGISIMGGEGKYFGIIFGVIILGVLSNGMTLLNIYDYYQMVIKCVVLIIAVGFDLYTKRSKRIRVKDIKLEKEIS